MSDKQKKKTNSRANWLVGGAVALTFGLAAGGMAYYQPHISQEQKFVEAAESGNIENMDHALSKGADIAKWAGFNALSGASEGGHLDAVKHLLALHNFSHNDMYRAAAKAARGGHNDILEFFISKGLDVNAKFKYGSSLIESAAWGNHLDTVEFLLQNNTDLSNPNTDARGALGYALQEGYYSIVKRLLDAGMDVHTDTYRGNVLTGGALGGHKDIVELAFEYDADVTAENHAATRKAAEYGYFEIVDLLIERGGSQQAANEGFAMRAADKGDISGFKELLKKQPEILEAVGSRLMGGAAYHNNKAFIEMLIGEGLTSAESIGSAVTFAAQDGYNDILELLLKQNADFQGLSYDPINEALFYATQNNHVETVKILLAHGADPRIKADNYSAPIDMTERKPEIAKIFARHLADNSAKPAVPSP